MAKRAKINRYTKRITQYRQDRLFKYDQSKFYKELEREGETAEEQIPPYPGEAKHFRSGICSGTSKHKEDVKWLRELDWMGSVRMISNVT